MKSRKLPGRRANLQFERLEDRLALAGDVALTEKISTVGGVQVTDITLTGDVQANDISITRLANGNVQIVGNATTISTKVNGVTVPLPSQLITVPAGGIRKLTLDLKAAQPVPKGPLLADAVSVVGIAGQRLVIGGDLSIKGKNGGVVGLDHIEARGATTITFGSGFSAGDLGSSVTILDSKLGLSQVLGKKGKNTTITTGDNKDNIFLSTTEGGGNISIDAKGAKTAAGSLVADTVLGTTVTAAGDLSIKGKNGGVVGLQEVTVRGGTTISFGNGISNGGEEGSRVTIIQSSLGLIQPPATKGKNLAITTGDNRDLVIISAVGVGGNISIDTKGAKTTVGGLVADSVFVADAAAGGDLTVKGKNGGVVDFDNVEARGATNITFGIGVSAGDVGSTVTILDSELGLSQQAGKKGKNTTITTGISNDRVLITDTQFGGVVAINVKDGNNNVAMLGTRSDAGGVFNSSTIVHGNLTITTGSGLDRVGVLGLVVEGKLGVATGKGNDFSGAADMAVTGTTSVSSLDGDDVAAIGLRDALGNELPQNAKGNVLIGNVSVSMGNGNDTVAAHKTTFGGFVNGKLVAAKSTITLGAGNDMLAEDENFFVGKTGDQFADAFEAIKGSRGGAGFDTLLSELDPSAAQLNFLQFESNDINQLPVIINKIFAEVEAGFSDILSDYGIDIGGGGGGADDHGDTRSLASLLGDLPAVNIPGSIGNTTDVDMFSFTLSATQVVEFHLIPQVVDLNAALRLFDADGNEIAVVDSSPAGGEEQLTLSLDAGTYFVGVSGSGNIFYSPDGGNVTDSDNAGAYTLTVAEAQPDDDDDAINDVALPTLPLDTLTPGEIDNRFDVDLYRIVLTGQNVTINLAPDSSPALQLFLRIFDAIGDERLTTFAAPGDSIELSLSDFGFTDGTFFVGVSSFGNNVYLATDGTEDTEGNSTGFYLLSMLTV